MSTQNLALWAAATLCLLVASATLARPLPPSNIDIGGSGVCNACEPWPIGGSVYEACIAAAHSTCIARQQQNPCSPADRAFEEAACCAAVCSDERYEHAVQPTATEWPEGTGLILVYSRRHGEGGDLTLTGLIGVGDRDTCLAHPACLWQPVGGNPFVGDQEGRMSKASPPGLGADEDP